MGSSHPGGSPHGTPESTRFNNRKEMIKRGSTGLPVSTNLMQSSHHGNVLTRNWRNKQYIGLSRYQGVAPHIKGDIANARRTNGTEDGKWGKLCGQGVILIHSVQVKREDSGAWCDHIDTHGEVDLGVGIGLQHEECLNTAARRRTQGAQCSYCGAAWVRVC